ncbi:MAG TPA: SDR family oxidoreductase [Nitrospiraceae bacterium]|nr:SDR family oxidoreductase [Nitrospiraceae bacterium]
MRVLVTGTDGYIGTMLGPVLIERGHEVVGLDTGFYREGWLYNSGIVPRPACLNKDIRHIDMMDLIGFDAVVHLAELSNDPLGQFNPDITFEINHRGTVELARQCRLAGISRFLYTSSCSVYGAGADDYCTERSQTNPQTAYANCKVLVERDVSAMADDRFSPTFLRNATAYGASPRMRFDLVLNNLAGMAWTTGAINMTSDGTPWRPLVHVLDICQAIACALEAPRDAIHNEIFNVGDSQANYRVREVAEIVTQVFPQCDLHFGKSDGDSRSYRVSFDKINSRLPGFRCQHDVMAGAVQLRDLFATIAMSPELFQSRSYTRLRQLEFLVKTKQLDSHFFWRSAPCRQAA